MAEFAEENDLSLEQGAPEQNTEKLNEFNSGEPQSSTNDLSVPTENKNIRRSAAGTELNINQEPEQRLEEDSDVNVEHKDDKDDHDKESEHAERNDSETQHKKLYMTREDETVNTLVENKETIVSELYTTREDEKVNTFNTLLENEETSDSDILSEVLSERDKYDDQYQFNVESSKHKITPVTIRKSKKKEVTIGTDVKHIEEDEDNEWVWVAEEVDEEIEVETDEESFEHESAEEESDHDREEIIDEEIEEYHEDLEGTEIEDEEIEEIVDEEGDEEYKEIYEEVGQEILEEEMYEIPDAEVLELEEKTVEQEMGEEETVGEEYQELEEDVLEEEILEEELGEVPSKKKKRKFKTIKIMKMVKKRRKDVIQDLKAKVSQSEEEPEDIFEEKEDAKVKEEEEKEKADQQREKERLYELIKSLANQIITMQRKNKLLAKSIIDFYKQKKSENILQTESPTPESIKKYNKRLKMYREAKLAATTEINRIINEVETNRDELNAITKEYEKEKAELLAWETELGRNVVAAQTGRPLEESAIKHVIQRHEILLQQLSEELHKLIKLQAEITSIEAQIKQLVVLDGNLNLIDFEQLKMDNHMFSEKLEERDNELANLRENILEIIHTQAHVLEKSDSITEDIENSKAKHNKLQQDVMQLREKVAKLRNTRDKLRNNTIKMRQNAGLLIRPRLAIDYEETLSKIEVAQLKVKNLKTTFDKQKVTIAKLRKSIKDTTTYNFFLN